MHSREKTVCVNLDCWSDLIAVMVNGLPQVYCRENSSERGEQVLCRDVSSRANTGVDRHQRTKDVEARDPHAPATIAKGRDSWIANGWIELQSVLSLPQEALWPEYLWIRIDHRIVQQHPEVQRLNSDQRLCSPGWTYCELPMTNVPLGIRQPLYSSSRVVA
jgi:hypothetical protein